VSCRVVCEMSKHMYEYDTVVDVSLSLLLLTVHRSTAALIISSQSTSLKELLTRQGLHRGRCVGLLVGYTMLMLCMYVVKPALKQLV